jgi:hypothetical protein
MTSVTGWWELVSWKQNYDDGREVVPLGENPLGRLTYSSTGDFSVIISRPDRLPFSSGQQWSASTQEKAEAYEGMLAYFGKYDFDGETMSHHVEVSLYPNWVGHTQIRTANIENGVLRLTARLEESTSEARTAELVWRHISS